MLGRCRRWAARAARRGDGRWCERVAVRMSSRRALAGIRARACSSTSPRPGACGHAELLVQHRLAQVGRHEQRRHAAGRQRAAQPDATSARLGVDVRARDQRRRAATPRAGAARRPRAPGRPRRPARPAGAGASAAARRAARARSARSAAAGRRARGAIRSRPSAASTAMKIAAKKAKIVFCTGRGRVRLLGRPRGLGDLQLVAAADLADAQLGEPVAQRPDLRRRTRRAPRAALERPLERRRARREALALGGTRARRGTSAPRRWRSRRRPPRRRPYALTSMMFATSSTAAVTLSSSVSAVSPGSSAAARSSTSREVSSAGIVASRRVGVSASAGVQDAARAPRARGSRSPSRSSAARARGRAPSR